MSRASNVKAARGRYARGYAIPSDASARQCRSPCVANDSARAAFLGTARVTPMRSEATLRGCLPEATGIVSGVFDRMSTLAKVRRVSSADVSDE